MAARAGIPIRRWLPFALVTLIACTSNISPQSETTTTTPPASSIQPSTGPSPSPATTVKLVPAAHQLPAPVQRAVAVNDGKQILIAGGLDANGTSTNGVFAYSPQTGHIAQVGSVPQAFHDAAGAMIGKDLFVFGGGSTESSDAVQSFDPSTGKGTVRGHLPMALSDLTGATIGHTVYLVGGWNGTSPQPTVWSTTDGTHFTKVATLPAGVRYPAVAAVGSNLVVAGGELASSTETTARLAGRHHERSRQLACPTPRTDRACDGVHIRRHRLRRRWTRRRRHRARHRDRDRSLQRQADGGAEDAGCALRFRGCDDRRRADGPDRWRGAGRDPHRAADPDDLDVVDRGALRGDAEGSADLDARSCSTSRRRRPNARSPASS